MEHCLTLCVSGSGSSTKALKTLRNAQVRRISWVRGVRPVRGRHEWPPHDAAPDRPPFPGPLKRASARPRFPLLAALDPAQGPVRRYLILPSRNSTCLRATGSYFFLTSLSVWVREFFLVT